MGLIEDLEKTKKEYEDLEKESIELGAQSKIRQKELKQCEANLKKLTGLEDLKDLPKWIEKFEKELNTKSDKLFEKVAELKSKLVTLKTEDSPKEESASNSNGLKEILEDI